jgi:predicted Fe-Mo cluster-binding NifX family protein
MIMRVAFPIEENNELESRVFGHYGSAPRFVMVDSETGSLQTVDNRDKDHLHGQCQPLKALDGEKVDAVVVGGIGAGALFKLNASGIKVYRAIDGSVADNLKLIESGVLPELMPEQTCIGHSSGGGCAH